MPAGIKYSLIKVKTKKGAGRSGRSTKGKIRVGIIIGPKNCDPILPGTQDKNYPEHLKVKNNTGKNASGWGGQYQVDTNLGLKLERKYPDVFSVDIIPGSQITPTRLMKNHINFNLGYDMVNANMSGNAKHEASVKAAFKSPSSKLYPEWDYQDWIYCKERYLQQCDKAGVKIAETIFLSSGIKPEEVLQKVEAKGWDRFFIKPGHLCSFGFGGGKFKTAECVADPSLLTKYAKEEAKGHKHFLVQPYIVKPNGQVFDEVRNWFINGKWSYAIYTDGTDEDAVYPLKPNGKGGHLIEPTRKVAEQAYKEVLKVSKWRGKSVCPPMTRIDVGVVPIGNSKTQVKAFVNEIETEAATWLVRYVPFDIVKHMVSVFPIKIDEFTRGLKKGEPKPDAAALEKLALIVKKLEGGEELVKTEAATKKRKREAVKENQVSKRKRSAT